MSAVGEWHFLDTRRSAREPDGRCQAIQLRTGKSRVGHAWQRRLARDLFFREGKRVIGQSVMCPFCGGAHPAPPIIPPAAERPRLIAAPPPIVESRRASTVRKATFFFTA